jgi:SAM-dependent methyltransferase
MVTKEEVIYAYRMLLGREPESEEVVAHYATEMKSVAALRELFMASAEFRQKAGDLLATRRPRKVLTGKPMQVEWQPSGTDAAQQLEALFARVAMQWQHLGETDPHWSVLTNDSYRADQIADNEQAFFATGEAEMVVLEATLARHGLRTQDFSTCLELGCGVGRATRALARRFARTIGVDVSAAHLAVAQSYTPPEGSAIEWRHLRAMDEAARLGRHDLMYSQIVLQHNPPPVMVRLLEDLLWQLNPGGVAYFQVPTYKAGYRFAMADYLEADNDSTMEMHFLPQDALLDLIARCRCRVLEIREDDAIGGGANTVSNTLLVRKAAY